jgi:hypothetical protein
LWNGNGLASSAAATDLLHATTLGVIVNDNGSGGVIRSTLDGQSVDVNTVLVKYTYTGDADLDGDIDADDYARIDGGFASHLSGYRNGDFNFSGGTPNSDDYFQIDRAFYNQGAALSSAVTPPPTVAFAASSTIVSAPTKKAVKKPAKHAVTSTNTEISMTAHKAKKKHWSDRFNF